MLIYGNKKFETDYLGKRYRRTHTTVTISDQLHRASWTERGFQPLLATGDIPASVPLLLRQAGDYIELLEQELFFAVVDRLMAAMRRGNERGQILPLAA